jgi:hypothetical protein
MAPPLYLWAIPWLLALVAIQRQWEVALPPLVRLLPGLISQPLQLMNVSKSNITLPMFQISTKIFLFQIRSPIFTFDQIENYFLISNHANGKRHCQLV